MQFTHWLKRHGATLFFLVAILAIIWPLALLGIILEQLPTLALVPFNAVAIVLPYLWLKPKWRWAVLLPVWGVAIYALCNWWYLAYFKDMIPFSSLLAYGNLDPLLYKSILLVVKPKQAVMLGGAILATASYFVVFRQCVKEGRYSSRSKAIAVIVAVVPLIIGEVRAIQAKREKNQQTMTDAMRDYLLNSPADFAVHAEYRRGIVPFLGRNIWHRFIIKPFKTTELTAVQAAQVEDWWTRHDALVCSNDSLQRVFAPNRDKSLIFIVVESLNAFAVHAEVNGAKVMPCLSSLATDPTVTACLNMRSQIKAGASSDGQLMYNTGLYPTTDGVVALDYADNSFTSLAQVLDRYSIELICEKPTMWNHTKTNQAYGYDGLISDIKQQGISRDQALFQQVSALMDTLTAAPSFIFATTIGMHTPYQDSFAPTPTFIAQSDLTEELKNYYTTCHAFDQALAAFLQRLKTTGHYHNSVIAIASDHAGDIASRGQEQPIVFMVLNSGYGKQLTEPMGQVDVFPTLVEIMGRNNDTQYKGMGFSVFNPNHAKLRADNEQLQEATEISNLMMSYDWFRKRGK